MALPGVIYPWDGPDNKFWEDLRFPAQGINPPGPTGAPDFDKSGTTGLLATLLFDPGTIEVIGGIAQMPHGWAEGSEIHPHIHWTKTSSASGLVLWEFAYQIANAGDAFPGAYSAWEAATVRVDTADTDLKHGISEWSAIDMTGFRASAVIAWKVRRKASDASDTYAADARLLEFDIHYQANRFGSPEEFPSHA